MPIFNLFKNITKYLISFFVYILLKIIFITTNKKFALVRGERIGHLVGEIDLLIRKKKFEKINTINTIIIINNPCNFEVVTLLRSKVTILCNNFIYSLFFICKRNENFSNIFENTAMSTLAEANESLYFYNSPPYIKIHKKRENLLYSELEKYNIKTSDWWVTFHNRDSAYLENTNLDFSYHDFRDFNINSMIEAMNFVTELGGYAIRIGRKTNQKIDSNNSKIIDLTNDKSNDFIDIYTIAKSKYFIGNTSGLFHIAKLFSIPYCITNLIGYLDLPQNNNSLFLPKKIQQNNKLLTFNECKNLGFFDQKIGKKFYFSKTYYDEKLVVINNTSKEILNATKDLIKFNSKNDKINTSQIDFKDRYFEYAQHRNLAANIAPSFIEINKNLF